MNFVDDILLVKKYRGCPGNRVGKCGPWDQSGNEVYPISPDGRYARQTCPHQAAEDNHIDQDSDQGIDERPGKTESRTGIPFDKIPFGKFKDQAEVRDESPGMAGPFS